jgi:hypothetical protein
LILQLIDKDPTRRPASALSVAGMLASIERGLMESTPNPAATLPKSRHRITWLSVGLAIALVSVVALIVFRIETPEGEFVVEADDPRVAITAEKSGGIKLIHRDTGRQYVVKSQ